MVDLGGSLLAIFNNRTSRAQGQRTEDARAQIYEAQNAGDQRREG